MTAGREERTTRSATKNCEQRSHRGSFDALQILGKETESALLTHRHPLPLLPTVLSLEQHRGLTSPTVVGQDHGIETIFIDTDDSASDNLDNSASAPLPSTSTGVSQPLFRPPTPPLPPPAEHIFYPTDPQAAYPIAPAPNFLQHYQEPLGGLKPLGGGKRRHKWEDEDSATV